MKTILFAFVLTGGILLAGCNQTPQPSEASTTEVASLESDAKVKVYYFHYSRRCATCNTVESETKLALNNLYGDQMKDNLISFQSINLEEPAGEALAAKLEVEGQSLLVVNGETKSDITEQGFLYAVNSPERLKAEIKRVVDIALN